jgi:hypothetical protein
MEALISAYDSASGSSDGGDNKEEASEETSADAKRQKFVGPLPATHSAPAPAAAVSLLPSPSAPSFTSTENVGGGLDLKYLLPSAGLKTTEIIKAKLMKALSFKDICLKMILCFPPVSCKSVVAIKDVSQNIAALRILFVSCFCFLQFVAIKHLSSNIIVFCNFVSCKSVVGVKTLTQTIAALYTFACCLFPAICCNQTSVSNIVSCVLLFPPVCCKSKICLKHYCFLDSVCFVSSNLLQSRF